MLAGAPDPLEREREQRPRGRRQPHHALPSYRTAEDHVVQCLAGGFGWRNVPEKDGSMRLVGRLPYLRATDIIVRDVPASQLMSTECVVTVRRRHQE